jgi:hypothetical protein
MKHMLAKLAIAIAAAPSLAATLHVANNGVDAPGCGTDTAPCRSISAAINAAVDDDLVLVRPGKYGDLDGDDALGNPGEETGNYNGAVYINKRITVLSTEGAGATVIRGISSVPFVVYMDASGAQFGERAQGFTVYGANSFGVSNNGMSGGKVAGNIAQGMAVGFFIVSTSAEVEISHNTAIHNYATGIVGASSGGTAGATFIHHNLVIGEDNSTGIAAEGTGAHRVVANRISNNTIGLQLGVGPSRASQNIITENFYAVAYAGQCLGCDPAPVGTPVVARNSLIGNRNAALWVSHLAEYPIAFRSNNIFSNGYGCGINTSTTVAIDARQNYWGAATGPSYQAPANGVCSTNDVVRTTPFATAEIPLN